MQAPSDTGDTHYIRTVTRLGDRHSVVANQDIYNTQGLKLVTKGSAVNSRVYEKLILHKLTPQIDQCLSIENAVTSQEIADNMEKLLAINPELDDLFATPAGKSALLNIAKGLTLNPGMAFKLTIAREEQHALFLHSHLLTILCIYLGQRIGFSEQELIQLASAALFHDIGLLHIDPELFRPGHVLTAEERRQLYSHPVIAFLIIDEFKEYSAVIAQAILEHHERLDGSGYPRGLFGDNISIFGKILAIAEVVTSRCDAQGDCHQFPRLEIMLKLNTKKLARDLVSLLAPLYQKSPVQNRKPSAYDSNSPSRCSALFHDWQVLTSGQAMSFKQQLKKEYQPLFDFINTQLQDLHFELREAGADPENLDRIIQDAKTDPLYLEDLHTVMNEAHWQVVSLINEAQRRWPKLFNTEAEGQAGLLLDWLHKVKSLNHN